MTTAESPRDPWHLKREIQLGHVITTLTVALSAVLYIGRMEQRIALVEQHLRVQRERDERQDSAMQEKTLALSRQLERMEAKLDRLIERNQSPKP
jgi:heme exporter protein D